MSADHIILTLNSGSSSVKFALHKLGVASEILCAVGEVEHIGLPGGQLWIRNADEEVLSDIHRDFSDHEAALHATFTELQRLDLPQPAAVGHRLVHGGPTHIVPERVTPQ